MKFKNWLLKEEYLKTGSAIIYHRTKKEALSGIIATGFQAGAEGHAIQQVNVFIK